MRSYSRWAPSCIGPYSQASTLAGAGRLVHCAGQIALDPATMALRAEPGPVSGNAWGWHEALLCVESCRAVLEAHRSALRDVVGAVFFVSGAVPRPAALQLQRLVAAVLRAEAGVDGAAMAAVIALVAVDTLPRRAAVELQLYALSMVPAARLSVRHRSTGLSLTFCLYLSAHAQY